MPYSPYIYRYSASETAPLRKIERLYMTYAPVTPNGDHPAIALRSRNLKFCTKAQWHRRKVWNPRHHVAYNSLQYALGSLITLSLRPMCSHVYHQHALNALPMRPRWDLCALTASKSLSLRSHNAISTFATRSLRLYGVYKLKVYHK